MTTTGKIIFEHEYEELLIKLLKELDNQMENYGDKALLFPFPKNNKLISDAIKTDTTRTFKHHWIDYLTKLKDKSNTDLLDSLKQKFKNSRFEKLLSNNKIGTIKLNIDEFTKLSTHYPNEKELKIKYKELIPTSLSDCNTVIMDKDFIEDLEKIVIDNLKKEVDNITNDDVKKFVEFTIWLHEKIIKNPKKWETSNAQKAYKAVLKNINSHINKNKGSINKIVRDIFYSNIRNGKFKAISPPTLPFSIKTGRILNKKENTINLSIGLYGRGFGYTILYYLLKMYVHGDEEIKNNIANLIKNFTHDENLLDEDVKNELDNYANTYIKVIESINTKENSKGSDKNLKEELKQLQETIFINAISQLNVDYQAYKFKNKKQKSEDKIIINKPLIKFEKAHVVFINADKTFKELNLTNEHINYFVLEVLTGSTLFYNEINTYYVDISELYENGFAFYINNDIIDEVRTAIAALYFALDIYNLIKKNNDHYYIIINLPQKREDRKTTIHEYYYQMKEVLGSERVQIQFLEKYDGSLFQYKSQKKRERFQNYLNYTNECFNNLNEAHKKLNKKFASKDGEYYAWRLFNLYENEENKLIYPFVYIEVGKKDEKEDKDREKYLISIPTVLTMSNSVIKDVSTTCGAFKKDYLPQERNLYSSFYPYEFAIKNYCDTTDLCYILQYNREFMINKKQSIKIAYFEIKSIINGNLNYTVITTPVEEDEEKIKLSKHAKEKLKKWIESHSNILLEIYRVQGIEEAEEKIQRLNAIISEYFNEKILKDKNILLILRNSLYSCKEKDTKNFCIAEGLDSLFVAGVFRGENKHRVYTQITSLEGNLPDSEVIKTILKMSYVFSEHDDFPAVVGIKRIINPDATEKCIKSICLLCGKKLINNLQLN
jgi:hypothetical protein